MGDEVINNESNQNSVQSINKAVTEGTAAHNEVYGSTALDSNGESALASFKNTFIQPKDEPKQEVPKQEVSKENKWLPSVSITPESAAQKAAEEVQYRLNEERITARLREELTAILLADIEKICTSGQTEGNAALFEKVNQLRAAYGLKPLEYDPTLEDEAEDNNRAMAARRAVGHFAHGGFEVANSMWGMRGDEDQLAERAADSWEGSGPHLNIILNRSITRMGAAFSANYQTARFA